MQVLRRSEKLQFSSITKDLRLKDLNLQEDVIHIYPTSLNAVHLSSLSLIYIGNRS
jgi:hypothetical protein